MWQVRTACALMAVMPHGPVNGPVVREPAVWLPRRLRLRQPQCLRPRGAGQVHAGPPGAICWCHHRMHNQNMHIHIILCAAAPL